MVAPAVDCNEFAGTQCEYRKPYCRAIHDRPYDIKLPFWGVGTASRTPRQGNVSYSPKSNAKMQSCTARAVEVVRRAADPELQ